VAYDERQAGCRRERKGILPAILEAGFLLLMKNSIIRKGKVMKQILFVILNEFADWEAAPVAAAINRADDFCVKTVSVSKEAVKSIGGFKVEPDFTITEAMSTEFSGLILIGGNSWRTEEAKQVEQLVALAVKRNVVIGAICDATVFLGRMGLLNGIDHTSNQLEDLQGYAGDKYTGAAKYQLQQAVRGGNIVTANGTGNMEFGKKVLTALHVMSADEAEQWYRFYKCGYYEAMKK
jgi:putative intracellular protease/amidase